MGKIKMRYFRSSGLASFEKCTLTRGGCTSQFNIIVLLTSLKAKLPYSVTGMGPLRQS